jgi:uncharacterized protein YecE (DUF72 family)
MATAFGHSGAGITGNVRIGTSGWSYDDWVGPFYPVGTKPGDYLRHYAQHFDIVEVDSTFYRLPSAQMVAGWAARTPEHFGFALKMPRVITHEKVLSDCEADMDELVPTFSLLGPKLRSVLLQFGYFNRAAFAGPRPFFERLGAFCTRYAADLPLACEIRNRNWLTKDYFALLREHHVATALVEHAWLPPIDELIAQHDVATGPHVYVRLIGDREGIEKLTTTWDKVVVDRGQDLQRIAGALRKIARRAELLVFVNNHYAGHGPESCRQLRAALEAWRGSR